MPQIVPPRLGRIRDRQRLADLVGRVDEIARLQFVDRQRVEIGKGERAIVDRMIDDRAPEVDEPDTALRNQLGA